MFQWQRKKKNRLRLLQDMPREKKIAQLFAQIEGTGLGYDEGRDVFYAMERAWQGSYGYCRAYDVRMPYFHMMVDSEPVYFDYNGRTWLIELWKGQYGIAYGGEVGIYCATHKIAQENIESTKFQRAVESDMMPIQMTLERESGEVVEVGKRTWWLAAFRIGKVCSPATIKMKASITFPNRTMQRIFTDSLEEMGYELWNNLWIEDKKVIIAFQKPFSKQPASRDKLREVYVSGMNKLFYYCYRFLTRNVSNTVEALLYIATIAPDFLQKQFLMRFWAGRFRKE